MALVIMGADATLFYRLFSGACESFEGFRKRSWSHQLSQCPVTMRLGANGIKGSIGGQTPTAVTIWYEFSTCQVANEG